MEVVAIIPARAGSKGVPGKNIHIIDGKPLIAYSIEAALESKKLSKIIVSSDGEQIIEIASQFNRIECHRRLDLLADDKSPITDTIKNIIQNQKKRYDAIMLLQPTAPIRSGKQIDDAIIMLQNSKTAQSIISVTAMDDIHPARMYWKDEEDRLTSILPEFEQIRRQDIPKAYYRNGSIYLVRTKAFLRYNSVMAKPALGYIMPSSQMLNIDASRDIIIAEALIPIWKKGELK